MGLALRDCARMVALGLMCVYKNPRRRVDQRRMEAFLLSRKAFIKFVPALDCRRRGAYQVTKFSRDGAGGDRKPLPILE